MADFLIYSIVFYGLTYFLIKQSQKRFDPQRTQTNYVRNRLIAITFLGPALWALCLLSFFPAEVQAPYFEWFRFTGPILGLLLYELVAQTLGRQRVSTRSN